MFSTDLTGGGVVFSPFHSIGRLSFRFFISRWAQRYFRASPVYLARLARADRQNS